MALSTEDRQRVWRGVMRFWSNLREPVAGNKAQLLTTINETDTWIEATQASYNAALTYSGVFTAAQKTLIFCLVALMRADPTLLRRILGELD